MKMDYEERKNYLDFLDAKIEDVEFNIDYLKDNYDMSDIDVRKDIEYLNGEKECFEDVHRYVSLNDNADYHEFISEYITDMENVQKHYLKEYPKDIFTNRYIDGRLNCFRFLLKRTA